MPSRSEEYLQDQMQETDNPTVPGAGATYGLSVPTGVVARRQPQVIEKEVIVYEHDPNALIPLGDGAYAYKRVLMTPTGMQIPDDVTDEELEEVGHILDSLETSVQWNSADWFNRAENRVWGKMYRAMPDAMENPGDDPKYQTLADYAWVARNVDFSIRNRKLSFAHHRTIAPLSEIPDLQWYWLEYAATRQPKRLTVEQLKAEIRALELVSPQRQMEVLHWAISQPTARVSKLPEFERPALLPPPHLPGEVIEAQKKVNDYIKRLNNYVRGNLNIPPHQLEKEGRAIIEWIERVMQAGGE